MKITIKGSPKEVSELLETMRSGAKKTDLPPLLTDVEDINDTIKRNRETISAFKKGCELANQCEKNAPQAETAEKEKKQEVFESQMDLLSKASKDCLTDISLYQYLAPLTQAMITIACFHV